MFDTKNVLSRQPLVSATKCGQSLPKLMLLDPFELKAGTIRQTKVGSQFAAGTMAEGGKAEHDDVPRNEHGGVLGTSPLPTPQPRRTPSASAALLPQSGRGLHKDHCLLHPVRWDWRG